MNGQSSILPNLPVMNNQTPPNSTESSPAQGISVKSSPITSFNGPYRFLSNFYLVSVSFDGELYPSVEHAYQAAKTTNPAIRIEIMNTKSPTEARAIGKKLQVREDWDDIKLDVMKELVKEKFHNNRYMATALKDTGDAELIEGNWWGDRFWGVCRGQGLNHLGRILMEVRNEI
jgi:ribA/ribD-fused uncharacterized protein